MTHTNGFPTHPPEPREREAPTRVLVVELREGDVVLDTREPNASDIALWLEASRQPTLGALARREFVQKRPGVMGGQACITGTRLSVAMLEGLRRNGTAAEWILVNYPYITYEQLEAAWKYADGEGRKEIDSELGKEEDESELVQTGNPARDPRLTYIETNPATSFSVGGIEAAAAVDVSGPPVGTQELKLAATPLLESCGLCGGDGHTSSDHFAQSVKTDLTHDDIREHVRQALREEREGAVGKLISERADEILLTAGDIPRDGPHGGAIIARARIDALTRALDERLGRG